MQTPDILFFSIVAIILIEFFLGRFLDFLNLSSHREEIPEEMSEYYDEDRYAKAQAYSKANSKVGLLSSVFGTLLILIVLFSGSFGWLDQFIRIHTDNEVMLALLFFGTIYLISDLLSLPLSLYHVFVVEEKFGFNKMSLGTFFLDKLKGLLLGAIMGGGILALLTWIYALTGSSFWWIAWICLSLISLFLAAFYTSVFAPIFNKMEPLGAGSLRDSIEAYADSVGFPLNQILVMDGSRRSAKANAYFSGVAGKKSIVLYDTLVEQQEEEELIAVLAHEVGHYKHQHVLKSMLISILQMGVIFFILGKVLGSEHLSLALGATKPSFHIGILAFSMLYSPISLVTGVFMNFYSRKNEFEADAFAKKTHSAEYLSTALKKLSVNNLSNLHPHKLFVFFYYSHPPLLERLAALRSD